MADYPEAVFGKLDKASGDTASFDEIEGGLSDFGISDNDIEYTLSCLESASTERVTLAEFALALNKAFPLQGDPKSADLKALKKGSPNSLICPSLESPSVSSPQRANQLAPLAAPGRGVSSLAPISPAIAPAARVPLGSPTAVDSPAAVNNEIDGRSSALALYDDMVDEDAQSVSIDEAIFRLYDLGFEDAAIEKAIFGMGKLPNGLKKQDFVALYPVLRAVSNGNASDIPGSVTMPEVVKLEDTTGTLVFGANRSQKNCYTEGPMDNIEIRGAKYLKDKKKYKPDKAMFELVGFDVFKTENEYRTVLDWDDSVIARARRNAAAVGLPFPRYFIVHFMCPGEPNANVVQYFAEKPFTPTTPADHNYKRLVDNFFETDNDKFRKSRFKLISQCVQGPWLCKKAMGAPALIGKKLETYFNKAPGVIEVTVDVGSSMIARATLSTVGGALTSLILDIGFTIEGKKDDELPERLLGCTRIQHVDLDTVTYTR